MQDLICFFIRYTPFWSVGMIIIAVDIGYVFWLKGYKRTSLFFFLILLFALSQLIFYILAGGGDAAVRSFLGTMNTISNF